MSNFSETSFQSKDEARKVVWDALESENVVQFPFPPHGRIPNFAGAREAANRLFNHPVTEGVKTMKVNPDAPQRYVREQALRHGIILFMPTPRLRAGFKKFDPRTIPEDKYSQAASLSKGEPFAETVSLDALPQMDLIGAGSVAVTLDGQRCGKGEGYSDIEYAILRELGHDPVPVATTVHPVQVVGAFPTDPHDISLSLIITPEEEIEVENPGSGPTGIDWDKLTDEYLLSMPILKELRDR